MCDSLCIFEHFCRYPIGLFIKKFTETVFKTCMIVTDTRGLSVIRDKFLLIVAVKDDC